MKLRSKHMQDPTSINSIASLTVYKKKTNNSNGFLLLNGLPSRTLSLIFVYYCCYNSSIIDTTNFNKNHKKKKIVHPIVNHLTRRLQGILTPFNSLNSEKLDCLDSEIMFHTSNTVEFLLLHTFSPEVKQIVFIRPEHILSNGTAVHTPTHPPTYPQNRQEQSIASSKYSVVAIFLFRVTKHNKIIQIVFII